MLSHIRFLLLTGIFAIVSLCCQAVSAQTSSAQEAKPGTISGRVVNESGRPLPNANVSARRWGLMQSQNIQTSTDREGKFELTGLEPVNYQVFAYRQAYVPLLRDLDETQPTVYRAGDSVTLVLT